MKEFFQSFEYQESLYIVTLIIGVLSLGWAGLTYAWSGSGAYAVIHWLVVVTATYISFSYILRYKDERKRNN